MALLLSWRPSSAYNISFPFTMKNTSSSKSAKMGSFSTISCSITSSSASTMVAQRKLPILLFDVMDTIVRDPFYHDVPAFFRMSMKELLESKHPTSWIEFEKGLISEEELTRKFFKDERSFDMEGLKNCMRRRYSYLEGVEGLLNSLKKNGYEIHAFTNYPIWYQMIEDELKLSNYLSWTFCSCIFGKRKPDPDFYLEVVKHLNVNASNCIFVDDRMGNVEAAIELGLKGLQFKNADLLRKDLSLLGVDISTNESQDLIECSS
ncbi:flavin mononucleotide hydrolase 1, chloroplatic [Solanum pennellii]|uniref:Flavin mononucleotide hydrolase 1, chloroplatic n=1 Tax=Solanum pennellii TaxID=28526 RepID=A0ABM1GV33_SOLPN|nr:flavin mononucleotide hydrolase 1, chloroplatic [Solanum pennellii]